MPDYQLLNKIKEQGDGAPIAIAICNDKGGSAKTTTAINISEALARIEFENGDDVQTLNVLLIDGDDSRTCSIWGKKRNLGKHKGSFRVCNEKEAVSQMMKSRPDVLVYDTAGGIKTNEMTELGNMCNFFILPCKPDFFNSVGTFIMAEWLIEKNKNFKILISDASVAGNYARGNEIKELLKQSKMPYFEPFIKSSVKVTDANNFGVTVFDMSSARALSDAFSSVALETLELISKGQGTATAATDFDLSGISEDEINAAFVKNAE